MHSDSASRAQIEAIRKDIEHSREEMKDFHGRLIAIEERRKQ